MPFQKGNQFWKARTKHGRDKLFESPEILWEACEEYFEWIEEHPLWEAKPFAYQGEVQIKEIAKMHAMTLAGLCIFLDIDENTWRLYKERDDFIEVTTRTEKIIYHQKFSGAAAELLNPNIIARDLGLSEKIDKTLRGNVTHTHKVIRMRSKKAGEKPE